MRSDRVRSPPACGLRRFRDCRGAQAGAPMSLKDRITDDMKAAMRAKDAPRLLTIRGLLAAIKQREVDERIVARRRAPSSRSSTSSSSSARTRSSSSPPAAARTWSTRKAPSCRCSRATCRRGSAPKRSPPRSPRSSPRPARAAPGRHGQGHGRGESALRRPRRDGPGVGSGQGRARALTDPVAESLLQDADMTLPSKPSRTTSRSRRSSAPQRWPKPLPPDFAASSTTGPTSKAARASRRRRASRRQRAPPGSPTRGCRWRRTCTAPDEIARFAELLATLPKPILVFCRSGARSSKLFAAATAGPR